MRRIGSVSKHSRNGHSPRAGLGARVATGTASITNTGDQTATYRLRLRVVLYDQNGQGLIEGQYVSDINTVGPGVTTNPMVAVHDDPFPTRFNWSIVAQLYLDIVSPVSISGVDVIEATFVETEGAPTPPPPPTPTYSGMLVGASIAFE